MTQPLDLDAIEARANAATPGPWCTDSWEIYQGTAYEPSLSEWIGETCRGATTMEQDRADAEFIAAVNPVVALALVAEVRRLRELETAALHARAALAALCYDLEDPGSDALGALYLLQQATLTVDAPKDDTGAALLQHACKVLHGVADIADPELPQVSFFGPTFGPQVADWLRMLADRRPPAVSV